MKNTLSLSLALTLGALSQSFGSAGIFDDFIIVNTDSATFYDLGASTGNPDFEGSDLGEFDLSTGNLEVGGQTKSFKNSGSDVTGASIFYRVWSGSEGGPFAELAYSFQIDNVGGTPGDQQWGTDAAGSNPASYYSSNLISGLTAGNYTLEVYTQITTNGVDAATEIFSNNGGSNFEATFSVVPEPSSFAMFGGVLALGLVVLRRKIRR